jgi:hypothetical protein
LKIWYIIRTKGEDMKKLKVIKKKIKRPKGKCKDEIYYFIVDGMAIDGDTLK